MMDLLQVEVQDMGITVDHNMPCSIHSMTDHAILDGNRGVFKPGGKAQAEGWMLIKVSKRMKKFLKFIGVEG
jgi:hypothetical protein